MNKSPLRLMIVGSDQVDAIENFYVRYLKQEGVDLLFFPVHTLFNQYYYKSLRNKLAFRTGLSGIYKRLNRRFRTLVDEYKPNVIWVFKGMELYPQSLKWAKEKGISLVSYNPDNPLLFTGKGSGNSNVSHSIPLFDLHFTYNLDIRKKLENIYQARTALLPFGFDIDAGTYREAASQEEVVRLCFLGNPDRKRAAFINALVAEGVPIDLYGRSWDKWVGVRVRSAPGGDVRIFAPAYGTEMWKVLRKYRVQLNLMRIHNEDSHNMRTFEVPAIGGIMLAPDTTEHRVFFRDKEEVFLYKDVKDCALQAKQLLELTAAQAEQIRERARGRSLSSGYSYQDRAREFLEQIRSFYA